MFVGIITALTALTKAIPPLTGLCEMAISWFRDWETKRNEQQARERRTRKDSDVDAAIANILCPPADGKQPTTDAAGRLPGSGGSGTRVDARRVEDDK